MISTNKDFEGISSNWHPTTYYWSKGDTPPTNNVINGAIGIEMDTENNTTSRYFFDKSHNQWVKDGNGGGGGGGGGGGSLGEKQVNFIDYDGTLLHSYTAEEANALTALPENPSHTGLVAQGWDWTLAQIKAQLTAAPDGPIWAGQMYITQSGDTEIDVSMFEGRLSPILTIAVNGTITVDWGDNTTTDTVTGSSITTSQSVPHTYTTPGDYTIKIKAVDGEYSFDGSKYMILRKNTTSKLIKFESRVYANCVRSVRLGSSVTSIGDSAFSNCYSLASVTIPSSVTSIGDSAFSGCYSLASITIPSSVISIGEEAFSGCYSLVSVTIPSSVTSIGDSAFSDCYNLASVTIPSSVTSIGDYVFSDCYSLASVTILSSVTSIGDYAFSNCYSLASVTIPSSVTSIGDYAFSYCSSLASVTIPSSVTSIGDYAFSNCYSLASVTIPSSVTSIGEEAFEECYGVANYHIKPTSVPTGGADMFSNIVSDCVIYVPSESLEAYKADTHWSSYASYMQGE